RAGVPGAAQRAALTVALVTSRPLPSRPNPRRRPPRLKGGCSDPSLRRKDVAMRRSLLLLALTLLAAGRAGAAGLLIPEEKSLPPLAMLEHKVTIALEDQVAVTRVEQTFRNHTPRQLEATYVFPVPKGATVNKFTMWVDGKETKGELVPADQAREIYT